MSDIFLPLGQNPQGFRLNINEPRINDLYRRYKAWKGLTGHFPITDEQRFEFERYVIEKLEKENNPPVNSKKF